MSTSSLDLENSEVTAPSQELTLSKTFTLVSSRKFFPDIMHAQTRCYDPSESYDGMTGMFACHRAETRILHLRLPFPIAVRDCRVPSKLPVAHTRQHRASFQIPYAISCENGIEGCFYFRENALCATLEDSDAEISEASSLGASLVVAAGRKRVRPSSEGENDSPPFKMQRITAKSPTSGDTPCHFTKVLYLSAHTPTIASAAPGHVRQRADTGVPPAAGPLIDFNQPGSGIPRPRELLETILDGMTGHHALFIDGILHRDVSVGNISRYRKPRPIECRRLPGFACMTKQDLCRGYLIDGDWQAVRWREDSPARVPGQSGTLSFLSNRLLNSIVKRRPTIHTAIDDLESFLWVLVWVIVHILDHFEDASGEYKAMKECLAASGQDAGTQLCKDGLLRDWEDPVFPKLIDQWWRLSQRVAEELRHSTCLGVIGDRNAGGAAREQAYDQLGALCMNTYEEYLKAGYEFLDGMGDIEVDWPGRE
ncbi:hypothetical protein EVG20_g11013 [Dentipellis fragilis]|uniref:Fungal-type protein kinase domain-containing protein n=1 Tax=Dentipellis fragilis TaxID=205917 RepID=A0A4Y9XQD7_9AGAM|nr:hypothetical protein EVG20_g11013 [Dentipellis fragilis]